MNESILALMGEVEMREGDFRKRWETLYFILANEPDEDLHTANFLVGIEKGGRQTALKLIESNVQPIEDGIHYTRRSHNRLKGTIPYPVIDVYEDRS